MAGRWVLMNGRRVYFPPFTNQRFTGRPFWACTFTSMINGADVGFIGEIDRRRRLSGQSVGHVVRALARKSGDDDLSDGSSSRGMVAAVAARYHQNMVLVHDSPEKGRERLRHGKVLVAGLTYGKLPGHYRRWSPNFKDGHRVVCLGWRDGAHDPEDGDTKILDPLAARGADYAGEWIPWSAVTAAYWADEQVWIAPGQFLPDADVTVERSFSPVRTFRIAKGASIRAFMPKATGVAKQRTFDAAKTGTFDALVRIGQPADADPLRPTGRFIRVTAGPFAGMFLDPDNAGLTAPIGPDAPPIHGHPPVPAMANVAVVQPGQAAAPDLAPGLAVDADGTDDDVVVGDLEPAAPTEQPRRTAIPDEITDDDPDPPSGDIDGDD